MADQSLQLVLVTPEKTLLDIPVSALRFPMFDGQFGVLPGRAPAVGRLGFGELIFNADGAEHAYFIDGGFMQIKDNTVSILTGRCVLSSELQVDQCEEEFQRSRELEAHTELQFEERYLATERARNMVAVARKPR